MPKEVDHEARRRELADAVCRVIARDGLAGVSLRVVADEAGWSIGSMRYYFTTKDELLEFALRRVDDRIEQRLDASCVQPTLLGRAHAVIDELLPLDVQRREEALVWLAFVSRATTDAKLAPMAADVWSRLNEVFVGLLRAAVEAGELPADLDLAREGGRLQALIDGLVVHLVSAPERLGTEQARELAHGHLDQLRAASAEPDPA